MKSHQITVRELRTAKLEQTLFSQVNKEFYKRLVVTLNMETYAVGYKVIKDEELVTATPFGEDAVKAYNSI